jgi:hypothetical protein
MHVELLHRPPISGTIPERPYDAVGDCTWVRFAPADGEPWAGAFGRGGVSQRSAAVPFAGGRRVLVIAGGQGYVVDAADGALRYRTTSYLLQGAVPVPGRDLAAWGWTDQWVLGPDAERWDVDVALDGIERVTATAGAVRGEAWQGDGWHAFTLELDGWRLHAGPLVRAG